MLATVLVGAGALASLLLQHSSPFVHYYTSEDPAGVVRNHGSSCGRGVLSVLINSHQAAVITAPRQMKYKCTCPASYGLQGGLTKKRVSNEVSLSDSDVSEVCKTCASRPQHCKGTLHVVNTSGRAAPRAQSCGQAVQPENGGWRDDWRFEGSDTQLHFHWRFEAASKVSCRWVGLLHTH